MTWIEHSLVGVNIYLVTKGFGKKLSLSALLIASTVMMDMDHLWFRIATRTLLKENASLSFGFWLSSDTWTHSLSYLLIISVSLSVLFKERDMIMMSFLLGGFFHLLGDWLYRQLMLDIGLMWLWPFSWEMF